MLRKNAANSKPLKAPRNRDSLREEKQNLVYISYTIVLW